MEDLQNTIKQGESKHRTHLFLFRWGEKIARSGALAWPLLDKDEKPIRTIWSCAVRLVLLGALIGVCASQGMWWLGLIIYGVIHLVLFLIGSLMVSANKKILDKLDEEFDELWYAYLKQKAEEKDITIQYPCDGCLYDDGVQVYNNGVVKMPMERDYGPIRIFRNNEYRDGEAKEEYAKYRTNLVWFKEEIASMDFRQKFQVCTNEDNKMLAMTYLGPQVQLAMTKDKSIEKFYNIAVENLLFTANSDYIVLRPDSVDMYKFRPIGWYFKDIEKYCAELKKQCDEAHAHLKLLRALRGPKQ